MSQEQPRKPDDHDKAVTYGDVFPGVQGELAEKVVAPKDVAVVQAAENAVLGQTLKGGAAAALQSAAAQNEKAGVVASNDKNANGIDGGVSIKVADQPGRHIITESIGGQGANSNARNVDHEQKQRKIHELAEIVGQFSQRAPLAAPSYIQSAAGGVGGQVTIGEALEATAMTAGQKPVEWSDAAAIQAAEVRATGRTNIVPGGVAAAAQSAATLNARATKLEEKTKLGDILADATSKLPADKPATRRDAEGVTGAEMRNDPFLTTHPTGVAASVAAAARLNQSNSNEMPK